MKTFTMLALTTVLVSAATSARCAAEVRPAAPVRTASGKAADAQVTVTMRSLGLVVRAAFPNAPSGSGCLGAPDAPPNLKEYADMFRELMTEFGPELGQMGLHFSPPQARVAADQAALDASNVEHEKAFVQWHDGK